MYSAAQEKDLPLNMVSAVKIVVNDCTLHTCTYVAAQEKELPVNNDKNFTFGLDKFVQWLSADENLYRSGRGYIQFTVRQRLYSTFASGRSLCSKAGRGYIDQAEVIFNFTIRQRLYSQIASGRGYIWPGRPIDRTPGTPGSDKNEAKSKDKSKSKSKRMEVS